MQAQKEIESLVVPDTGQFIENRKYPELEVGLSKIACPGTKIFNTFHIFWSHISFQTIRISLSKCLPFSTPNIALANPSWQLGSWCETGVSGAQLRAPPPTTRYFHLRFNSATATATSIRNLY